MSVSVNGIPVFHLQSSSDMFTGLIFQHNVYLFVVKSKPLRLASWIGTIFIRIFIGSAYFDGHKVPVNIDSLAVL